MTNKLIAATNDKVILRRGWDERYLLRSDMYKILQIKTAITLSHTKTELFLIEKKATIKPMLGFRIEMTKNQFIDHRCIKWTKKKF